MQKKQYEAPNRSAFDFYSRVFPMTESFNVVYIFVGNVYAARESNLSVNYGNLSVVSIVLLCGKHGVNGVEYDGFDFML